MEHLKNLTRHLPLYRAWYRRRQDGALTRWARGTPGSPPPHLFKQHLIRTYAAQFSTPNLVETGTFLGETVEAMAPYFDHIHSIELDGALHRRAIARFSYLPNVSLHHGDSGDLLGELIGQIEGPCLFWLDGHYSGGVTARGIEDTPIRKELEAVLAREVPEDVILVDDARCFDGRNGYPTLEAMVAQLQERRPGVVAVAEDIIRASPRWP